MDLSEILKCVICQEQATLPILLDSECEHMYCYDCYNNLKEHIKDKTQHNCPVCNKQINNIEHYREPIHIWLIMDLNKNIAKCQCLKEFTTQSDLMYHKKNECNLKPHKCPNCDELIMPNDTTHNDHCPDFMIKCKCSLNIKRKDLDYHKNTCPIVEVNCTNCTLVIQRKKLLLHKAFECEKTHFVCVCTQKVLKTDYDNHLKLHRCHYTIKCMNCSNNIIYCNWEEHFTNCNGINENELTDEEYNQILNGMAN